VDLLIKDINDKVVKNIYELAIDRLHTLFKGYIENICQKANIEIKDKSLDSLYGELLKYIYGKKSFKEVLLKIYYHRLKK